MGSFVQKTEVPCNLGTLLPIYQQGREGDEKHWVIMRDIMRIMIQHQQENVLQAKEGDGEVMVPLRVALYLLGKVEMDDFSITPTINALKALDTPPTL
jgi:hypothetical protein